MSSRNKTTVHGEPRERTSSTRLSGHGASRSNLQVKTPQENVMPAARIVDATAIDKELSARRLNVMRFGYAFMEQADRHHANDAPSPSQQGWDAAGRYGRPASSPGWRCCSCLPWQASATALRSTGS